MITLNPKTFYAVEDLTETHMLPHQMSSDQRLAVERSLAISVKQGFKPVATNSIDDLQAAMKRRFGMF